MWSIHCQSLFHKVWRKEGGGERRGKGRRGGEGKRDLSIYVHHLLITLGEGDKALKCLP